MTNVIFVERVAMVVCQTVSKEVFASIVSRDSWLTEKYLCSDAWLVQPPTPLATLVFRSVNGSKLKTHQWTLVCTSSHTTATAFFLKKSSENITQDLSSPTHDMGLPWRKSISAVPLIVLILALSKQRQLLKRRHLFHETTFSNLHFLGFQRIYAGESMFTSTNWITHDEVQFSAILQWPTKIPLVMAL